MRRGQWGKTRNWVPYLVCSYRAEGHLYSEESGRNDEEEAAENNRPNYRSQKVMPNSFMGSNKKH